MSSDISPTPMSRRISKSDSQSIQVEVSHNDAKCDPEINTKMVPRKDFEVSSLKGLKTGDSAPGTPKDSSSFRTTPRSDEFKRRDILIPVLLHAVLVVNVFSVLKDEDIYEFGNMTVELGFLYVFLYLGSGTAFYFYYTLWRQNPLAALVFQLILLSAVYLFELFLLRICKIIRRH